MQINACFYPLRLCDYWYLAHRDKQSVAPVLQFENLQAIPLQKKRAQQDDFIKKSIRQTLNCEKQCGNLNRNVEMFLRVMGISEKTPTAVQSCELKVRYVRIYSSKVFYISHFAHYLSLKKGKNHLKRAQKLFSFFKFDKVCLNFDVTINLFRSAILQNVH